MKPFLLPALLLALCLCTGCNGPVEPTADDSDPSRDTLAADPPSTLEENITGRIFYTERDAAGRARICSIWPNGLNYIKLVEGGILLARPAAGRLLYMTDGNAPKIMASRLDGKDARVIHEGAARGELAPNGRMAACVREKMIVLVDIETGERRIIERATSDEAVSFSPDSRLLAFGDGENVRIIDVTTGATRRTIAYSYFNDYRACSWSPTGERLLVTAGNAFDTTNYLFIADTAGVEVDLVASDVGAFAWSPDGKKVAQKKVGQLLQLWMFDGKALNLICYSNIIPETTVDWSADGTDLIFTYNDGSTTDYLGRARAVVGGSAGRIVERGYGAFVAR